MVGLLLTSREEHPMTLGIMKVSAALFALSLQSAGPGYTTLAETEVPTKDKRRLLL